MFLLAPAFTLFTFEIRLASPGCRLDIFVHSECSYINGSLQVGQ